MNELLINQMANDFGIIREFEESSASWHRRVKYSILALSMLATLYDLNDEIDYKAIESVSTISHQHLTLRIRKLMDIFSIPKTIAESILKLYIKTGYILVSQNRLTYPTSKYASLNEHYLARGIYPNKASTVSGACMLTKSYKGQTVDLDDMFDLSPLTILQWFTKFIKTINNWKQFNTCNDYEYLNLLEHASKGYWTNEAQNFVEFSLCRSKDKINYWLLSNMSGAIECATLPDWITLKGEYYRIAIALRVLNGNPPRMKALKRKNTVTIIYDYILPPAEQNFIELCSWYADDNDSKYVQKLHRVFSKSIYPVALYKRMGYIVKEIQV
jgi:hypothetical protein